MPLPLFTKDTTLDPSQPENPFLIIGREALPYTCAFGPRNWAVYTILGLCSNVNGLAEISLPELAGYCGNMNRKTLQKAIKELCGLRVQGRRVLRKVRATQYGKNRYVFWPDREDAPLSSVPDDTSDADAPPAPVKRRGPRPAPPRPAPRPTDPASEDIPMGWATDEEEPDEEPEDPAPVPVSSPKNALLNPDAVDQKTDYSDPEQVGQKMPLHRRDVSVSRELEDTEKYKYRRPVGHDAKTNPKPVENADNAGSGQGADKTKKKRQAPTRDTENPKNAADCVALYVELFTKRYDRAPSYAKGGPGALGAHFKRMIDRHSLSGLNKAPGAAQVAAVVRHFLKTDRYQTAGHAAEFLIRCWDSVAAYAEGRIAEARAFEGDRRNRRQEQAVTRLRDEAEAEGGDFLPDHIRAAFDGDEDDAAPDAFARFNLSDADEADEADEDQPAPVGIKR